MMWLGCGAGALGLITTVVGSFLPWLRSGTVNRDSYEVLALRGWAGLGNGYGEVIRVAWVSMTPVAVCCVLLFTFGLRRFAAWIGILFGTITGTVAALATVQGSNEGAMVGISLTGPAVALCGAVLAIAGAITVLTASARAATSKPGGTP